MGLIQSGVLCFFLYFLWHFLAALLWNWSLKTEPYNYCAASARLRAGNDDTSFIDTAMWLSMEGD